MADDDQEWFDRFRDGDSDEIELGIDRGHIEPGKSFSEEALVALRDQFILFVGARVMRGWRDRNEPPTMVRVSVRVEIVG